MRSQNLSPSPKSSLGTLSPTGRLLDVLLDAPDLVRQVRALSPPLVTRLVNEVGLEDAGEMLALLTNDQLTSLLDEVLWEADDPGADESFSPQRFVTWLEVMLEAGDEFVADRLADLSEDLLTLAVSRLALVLDVSDVESEASDGYEGELVEKALDSCAYHEQGDYFLIARGSDGWDALVASLVALDQRHSDVLERVLHRCWSAAHEEVEESGGLRQWLSEDERIEVDAAAEREDRRAALGYVSPASARAFLGLAAKERDPSQAYDDPITRAYFRELDVERATAHRQVSNQPSARSDPLPQLIGSLDSSVVDAEPVGLPPSPVRQLVEQLAVHDPKLHAQAIEELAFLTNVLVAGAAQGRPWRPAEAAEEVLSVCSRGLERLDGGAEAPLVPYRLIAAFRAGWGVSSDSDPS